MKGGPAASLFFLPSLSVWLQVAAGDRWGTRPCRMFGSNRTEANHAVWIRRRAEGMGERRGEVVAGWGGTSGPGFATRRGACRRLRLWSLCERRFEFTPARWTRRMGWCARRRSWRIGTRMFRSRWTLLVSPAVGGLWRALGATIVSSSTSTSTTLLTIWLLHSPTTKKSEPVYSRDHHDSRPRSTHHTSILRYRNDTTSDQVQWFGNMTHLTPSYTSRRSSPTRSSRRPSTTPPSAQQLQEKVKTNSQLRPPHASPVSPSARAPSLQTHPG